MYKTRILRKIIKQIKGFYSLSDCKPALKCRMTTFKSPPLLSLACLDSPAPGTLKRQIIEKEDISLTGIAYYSLS